METLGNESLTGMIFKKTDIVVKTQIVVTDFNQAFLRLTV